MYTAITELGYIPGTEEIPAIGSPESSGAVPPEPIASSLADAASSGKLILVDFYAEWCIACKALEETLLGSPAVAAALDNYLFLKVDTDLYEQAASFYQVLGMPTLLILDTEGNEIYRTVGTIEPEEFSTKLNELAR